MNAKTWVDTPQQPDRRERKQAEFLVHRFVPWPLIHTIGVIDAQTKGHVQQVLVANTAHKPMVVVRPDWYY